MAQTVDAASRLQFTGGNGTATTERGCGYMPRSVADPVDRQLFECAAPVRTVDGGPDRVESRVIILNLAGGYPALAHRDGVGVVAAPSQE
jgi:hypothetical protein